MKVVFAIPSLSAGGAERVMSYVARNLNRDRYETSLLVLGRKEDAVYPIEDIEVIFLEKEKIKDAFFLVIRYINKKKPEVIISAIAHLNTMMALISILFPKTKFVGRETNVQSISSPKPKTTTRNKILAKIYKFQKYLLDAMICQSQDMKEDMIQNFDFPENKLVTIHNPVSEQFTLKDNQKYTGVTRFITVSRLAEHKGHIRILNALSKFNEPYEYTIIGNGPYLENIIGHIAALGLSEKIKHIPYTDKVANYLQNHHVFLHGSYVEGFPNSMLESCAVGTPVVAYDAPGGINEIIESDVNGYIAYNETEFLQCIQKVVSKKYLVPEEVRKSVVDRYNARKIMKDYEHFIERLISS